MLGAEDPFYQPWKKGRRAALVQRGLVRCETRGQTSRGSPTKLRRGTKSLSHRGYTLTLTGQIVAKRLPPTARHIGGERLADRLPGVSRAAMGPAPANSLSL